MNTIMQNIKAATTMIKQATRVELKTEKNGSLNIRMSLGITDADIQPAANEIIKIKRRIPIY